MNVSSHPHTLDCTVYMGTCSWSHRSWAGAFYPPGLPASDRLRFYSRIFPAVEVDSTFYRTPTRVQVARWCDAVPPGFLFCCKMPKLITHDLRLAHCAAETGLFLDGLGQFGEHLGPTLIQLPPSFRMPEHEPELIRFLRALPKEMRFAVEFRQPQLHRTRLVDLLERLGICWAWHDLHPMERQLEAPFEFLPQTCRFVYLRLLGHFDAIHSSEGVLPEPPGEGARDEAMKTWMSKLRGHESESEEMFVFINNQYEEFAPSSVRRMAELAGIKIAVPPRGDVTEAVAAGSGQLRLF